MPTSGTEKSPWLLLIFRLPVRRASQRVEVWRKLNKLGARPIVGSGYLLPHTPETQEQLEWLAQAIRKYQGEASVAEVHALDNFSHDDLICLFGAAVAEDYTTLAREVRKARSKRKRKSVPVAKFGRRLLEIAARDYFGCPERQKVERLLHRLAGAPAAALAVRRKAEYQKRVWVTRPRPGIDRVASAWLICKFIDPRARFVFASHAAKEPKAIPFDMFQSDGFGHRGEDCTFETLCKEFGIRDARAVRIAQIVHDADLEDEKFGREEGIGLSRTLAGWAHSKLPDREILRRGMDLIEGQYLSARGLAECLAYSFLRHLSQPINDCDIPITRYMIFMSGRRGPLTDNRQSKRRVLLISNSTMHGRGYLDHVADEIKLFLGRVKEICFVPYALFERDAYARKVAERLAMMGCKLRPIHESPDPQLAVREAEAVFVGGGNTFRLLKALYDTSLMDVIREQVRNGIPFIGSSAGSIVAGPSLKTTKDMPIVQPASFDALGLVPFQISPHFLDPDPASTHMGETQEERIQQFLEENDAPVVGLREGSWIRVEGQSGILCGTTGARIFRKGHAPFEAAEGANLDALLT